MPVTQQTQLLAKNRRNPSCKNKAALPRAYAPGMGIKWPSLAKQMSRRVAPKRLTSSLLRTNKSDGAAAEHATRGTSLLPPTRAGLAAAGWTSRSHGWATCRWDKPLHALTVGCCASARCRLPAPPTPPTAAVAVAAAVLIITRGVGRAPCDSLVWRDGRDGRIAQTSRKAS